VSKFYLLGLRFKDNINVKNISNNFQDQCVSLNFEAMFYGYVLKLWFNADV
jgi:hypothetical protein